MPTIAFSSPITLWGRFACRFLAGVVLFCGVGASAQLPKAIPCLAVDPARAAMVRAILLETDAVFKSLRKPRHVETCLVSEAEDSRAWFGFLEIAAFKDVTHFDRHRAILYHEYGHHLFFQNIGRFVKSYEQFADFMDQAGELEIKFRAGDQSVKLKLEQAKTSALLPIFLMVDISEVMSDLTAVLMMRDSSAMSHMLGEIDDRPHPERDFASVSVGDVDPRDVHGRLWAVRQAIGTRYLQNPDGKKPMRSISRYLSRGPRARPVGQREVLHL